MRNGTDKGLCLNWMRLSYRRKFIRSLWAGPTMLALLFLVVPKERTYCGLSRDLIASGCAVGFCYQGISNYRKWREEKDAKEKISKLLKVRHSEKVKEKEPGIKSLSGPKVDDVFPDDHNIEYKRDS